MKAIIYTRVSTEEQGVSRNGLESQLATCQEYASRIGVEVSQVIEEVVSGAKMTNRPLLINALSALKSGEAKVLIVSKLDRLSRSVSDLCYLLEVSEKEGWSLVILDLNIDCTTSSGRMQAQIQATFAEFERRRIGERTKDGLAIAKAKGVKLGGSKPVIPFETVQLIALARQADKTFRQIADDLNALLITTSTGTAWSAGSVNWVLKSQRGQELMKAC
jgi:DNA invertase Pin-like site-specific DNA recombinase